MKLRLRSLQSKETLKLEVTDQCTLQQLKKILSHSISSSSALVSSLHLSLNRKDELSSPSMEDSLLSIGITSGDLIHFSLNPDDFSSSGEQTLGSSSELSLPTQSQQVNLQSQSESFDSNMSRKPVTLFRGINFQASGSGKCEISRESEVVAMDCSNQQSETLGISSSKKETLIEDVSTEGQSEESLGTKKMGDGEGMDIDAISTNADVKKISAPYFLKMVLTEEIREDFSDKMFLFLAVHAVFLESGFVGFDTSSGLRVDLFHLLQEQPLMNHTTSIGYTLPELLSDNVTESVVLIFQTIGHYVNVYGYLPKSRSGTHKLNLDKKTFVPVIGTIWAYFDNSERLNEIDVSYISSAESVLFQFWKIVKDQLVLPLLIDLCEKTGLNLPPCLMRLPADIKLRILEFLPGQYIARMACVCKEMKYLSSNSDLWKQKFAEEFGSAKAVPATIHWKSKFASSWESRKKQKTTNHSFETEVINRIINLRDEPYQPRMPPRMIGGDYDRLPFRGGFPAPFGAGPSHGVPGRFGIGMHGVDSRRGSEQLDLLLRHMRRNLSPNCNLGGSNAY